MAGANSGEYSRFLSFHGRNPDVLNSIANLSNDEVFTPPEFANRMLDTLEKAWADSNGGENIWANPDLKFLDPFTKSGVFLREIATRLIKGLELEIPDLQTRVDHILTKQVFGIATTQLTSLMARRSLYCSKKANGKHSITKKFTNKAGNIWFQSMSHTWKKGTIRELTMDESGNEVERYVDGNCKYCGASKRDFEREEGLELHAYGLIHQDDPKKWVGEIFGLEMQFDVIIGNPPYQLNDGGGNGTSASPIYQNFVTQAKLLKARYLAMVIPARWYSGGKGLDQFRAMMLNEDGLCEIDDFPDATSVFPGVQIKGGVCVVLLKDGFEGDVTVRNYDAGSKLVSEAVRPKLETGSDVFIRFNESIKILEKVRLSSAGNEPEVPGFVNRISTRQPFGLSSTAAGDANKIEPGHVEVLTTKGSIFVRQERITKGAELLNKWKLFVPFLASGSDSFPHTVISLPRVAPPGLACNESYLCVGPFESEEEAKNAASYMETRIFRFLVLLRKPSQNATRKVYEFVPDLRLDKPWSDADLIELFGISDEEFAYICTLVRE
jgi:hypothetical protein